MTLAAGARVGGYEVIGLLGQGGMGEVYRARDTTLGREVAIKTLAGGFANDAERVARFTREARVLAALNHPHIGAIYGVESGTAATPPALILELVEGETLEERLERSALPLVTALDLAQQIADAIDFAHERGVIHRDLKPANIKITPDGRAKVLDFGIAKALGDDGPEGAPTATRTAVTREGIAIGTPAYMSPEQARGQVVDRRTDVWAFGCVLYEMLARRRAFPGQTGTDALVAVLERQPDWAALPPSTPEAIRRVLRRCLEKDTRQRLRDIADVRADLADTGPDDSQPTPLPRSGLRLLGVAAIALLAAILGFAVARQMSSPRSRAPELSRIVRLTSGPSSEFAPAISPDRKWVAYVAPGPSGRTDVWVRFVGGGDPINLTEKSDLDVTANIGIGGLAIAPEGNRIAVMARRRDSTSNFSTWEIPAPLPGAARKLLDDTMLGARWSPDGRRLTFIRAGASAGDALWVADADGTNRREIIPADGGVHIHWPAWSADEYVYFIRTRSTTTLDQSDIYRIRAEGGTPEPVVTTTRRAM
jgi:serine/threonine protein kinase